MWLNTVEHVLIALNYVGYFSDLLWIWDAGKAQVKPFDINLMAFLIICDKEFFADWTEDEVLKGWNMKQLTHRQ